MQLPTISPLCINRRKGDSIVAQISRENQQRINLRREFIRQQDRECVAFHLAIDGDQAAALGDGASAVWYLPACQRRETCLVSGSGFTLRWPLNTVDRYSTLLLTEVVRYILPVRGGDKRLEVELRKAQELRSEMWMLYIEDGRGGILSQGCFYAE